MPPLTKLMYIHAFRPPLLIAPNEKAGLDNVYGTGGPYPGVFDLVLELEAVHFYSDARTFLVPLALAPKFARNHTSIIVSALIFVTNRFT